MEDKKIVLNIKGLGQIVTTEDKIEMIHDIFTYASSHAWSFYMETEYKTFWDSSAEFNRFACEMHKYLK